MSTGCRKVIPLLEAFGDGELGADQVLDVEEHLLDCVACTERVRVNAALRLSMRRAVRSATPLTSAFQERIQRALAAETARERAVDTAVEQQSHYHNLSWRTVVPVAAAAALTLVWAASTGNSRASSQHQSYTEASLDNADQLLEQLVDHHVRAQRPQVTEPALLAQLEPEIGVPLKLPSLKDYGARWEGGSVVPVSNQHAASLCYRVDGHRVTLYVYNSTRMPIEGKLKARVVRNEPVYVGSRRGVSIAAAEHRGVGYAIATDLNDDESAELVASVY